MTLDTVERALERAGRQAILRAADSPRVRACVTRYGMRLGARRFVPAESLDEVVVAFRGLNDRGIRGNTGLFDDTAHDPTAVARHESEYARQIDRLTAEALDANVALKLTHLGAHVDPDTLYGAARRLAERAAAAGMRLRIDMEESEHVDLTLATYRRLRADGIDNVGVVLQSYLFRSEQDLDDLLPLGLNVRLVKGAYLEPPAVAFQDKRDVDAAYVRMLERSLREADFTAVATHDRKIIARAKTIVRQRNPVARPLRVPDAVRGRSAAADRARRRRLSAARLSSVRADLVSLPDAPPGRAAGERRLPPPERLHMTASVCGSPSSFRPYLRLSSGTHSGCTK